jgi:hypothetical protein
MRLWRKRERIRVMLISHILESCHVLCRIAWLVSISAQDCRRRNVDVLTCRISRCRRSDGSHSSIYMHPAKVCRARSISRGGPRLLDKDAGRGREGRADGRGLWAGGALCLWLWGAVGDGRVVRDMCPVAQTLVRAGARGGRRLGARIGGSRAWLRRGEGEGPALVLVLVLLAGGLLEGLARKVVACRWALLASVRGGRMEGQRVWTVRVEAGAAGGGTDEGVRRHRMARGRRCVDEGHRCQLKEKGENAQGINAEMLSWTIECEREDCNNRRSASQRVLKQTSGSPRMGMSNTRDGDVGDAEAAARGKGTCCSAGKTAKGVGAALHKEEQKINLEKLNLPNLLHTRPMRATAACLQVRWSSLCASLFCSHTRTGEGRLRRRPESHLLKMTYRVPIILQASL